MCLICALHPVCVKYTYVHPILIKVTGFFTLLTLYMGEGVNQLAPGTLITRINKTLQLIRRMLESQWWVPQSDLIVHQLNSNKLSQFTNLQRAPKCVSMYCYILETPKHRKKTIAFKPKEWTGDERHLYLILSVSLICFIWIGCSVCQHYFFLFVQCIVWR